MSFHNCAFYPILSQTIFLFPEKWEVGLGRAPETKCFICNVLYMQCAYLHVQRSCYDKAFSRVLSQSLAPVLSIHIIFHSPFRYLDPEPPSTLFSPGIFPQKLFSPSFAQKREVFQFSVHSERNKYLHLSVTELNSQGIK